MTDVTDLGVQGKDQSEIPDDKSKEPLGSECHGRKGRVTSKSISLSAQSNYFLLILILQPQFLFSF